MSKGHQSAFSRRLDHRGWLRGRALGVGEAPVRIPTSSRSSDGNNAALKITPRLKEKFSVDQDVHLASHFHSGCHFAESDFVMENGSRRSWHPYKALASCAARSSIYKLASGCEMYSMCAIV